MLAAVSSVCDLTQNRADFVSVVQLADLIRYHTEHWTNLPKRDKKLSAVATYRKLLKEHRIFGSYFTDNHRYREGQSIVSRGVVFGLRIKPTAVRMLKYCNANNTNVSNNESAAAASSAVKNVSQEALSVALNGTTKEFNDCDVDKGFIYTDKSVANAGDSTSMTATRRDDKKEIDDSECDKQSDSDEDDDSHVYGSGNDADTGSDSDFIEGADHNIDVSRRLFRNKSTRRQSSAIEESQSSIGASSPGRYVLPSHNTQAVSTSATESFDLLGQVRSPSVQQKVSFVSRSQSSTSQRITSLPKLSTKPVSNAGGISEDSSTLTLPGMYLFECLILLSSFIKLICL